MRIDIRNEEGILIARISDEAATIHLPAILLNKNIVRIELKESCEASKGFEVKEDLTIKIPFMKVMIWTGYFIFIFED